MRAQVLKFTLSKSEGHQKSLVPKEAKILKVAEQHGKLTLWAEVEPHHYTSHKVSEMPPKEESIKLGKNFFVAFTGHSQIPLDARFIETVLMENGHFVVHLYETP